MAPVTYFDIYTARFARTFSSLYRFETEGFAPEIIPCIKDAARCNLH